MFSKTFGYAVRALAYVAAEGTPAKKLSLDDIATRLEIPKYFLGKIMQDLVRQGMLNSAKGPNGGFYPNEKTLDTQLSEILKHTDGSLALEYCVLGIRQCNPQRPCLMHHEFAACKGAMVAALSSKTISTVVSQMQDGMVFLI